MKQSCPRLVVRDPEGKPEKLGKIGGGGGGRNVWKVREINPGLGQSGWVLKSTFMAYVFHVK